MSEIQICKIKFSFGDFQSTNPEHSIYKTCLTTQLKQRSIQTCKLSREKFALTGHSSHTSFSKNIRSSSNRDLEKRYYTVIDKAKKTLQLQPF